MRNSLLALVLLAGPLLGTSYAQPSSQPTPPLRGHVDWQAHPAMHVPYELYGEGLAEETPKKKLSWRHTLRQTMYAPYLRQSGVRILVAAAMAAERAKNGPQARALILSQLAHVRLFVRQNSADFALATSPAQARRILTTTRKIVVLQAIEGARWVLNRQADADYWARQGVMMMTLVHLQDDEFGGAAITLSGSEVPTSLERGVIEGVLTASAGGAKNWHEFLPYNYRFAVNYGNSMIIANADSFEALSPETQETLRAIVAEEGPATTAAFLEDEEAQKASQSEAGMTLVEEAEGDADMARERLAPFWEEWAEQNGPEYVEALQTVRDAIGK